jgi:hypothetical protein
MRVLVVGASGAIGTRLVPQQPDERGRNEIDPEKREGNRENEPHERARFARHPLLGGPPADEAEDDREFRKPNQKGRVKLLHVEFDGLPGIRFSYTDSGWKDVDRHLELAYAITVHKGQGSQFRHVFFVPPRIAGDFLGRELIYTALTPAQARLTLFIEKDISTLLPLRKRAAAQTPRRRSCLFAVQVPQAFLSKCPTFPQHAPQHTRPRSRRGRRATRAC